MAFKPNRNLIVELKRGPEFQALLDTTAGAVMTAAERESPIGFSEDYIHSFRITRTPTTRRVGNFDFAAHWAEWGSVNNPPYSPLRRGVRAVGLRFAEASAV